MSLGHCHRRAAMHNTQPFTTATRVHTPIPNYQAPASPASPAPTGSASIANAVHGNTPALPAPLLPVSVRPLLVLLPTLLARPAPTPGLRLLPLPPVSRLQ